MNQVDSIVASASDEPVSCRFCRAALDHLVVDLGMSPLCESFLQSSELNSMERFYPLRLLLCMQYAGRRFKSGSRCGS